MEIVTNWSQWNHVHLRSEHTHTRHCCQSNEACRSDVEETRKTFFFYLTNFVMARVSITISRYSAHFIHLRTHSLGNCQSIAERRKWDFCSVRVYRPTFHEWKQPEIEWERICVCVCVASNIASINIHYSGRRALAKWLTRRGELIRKEFCV